jgi:hypothetical protein
MILQWYLHSVGQNYANLLQKPHFTPLNFILHPHIRSCFVALGKKRGVKPVTRPNPPTDSIKIKKRYYLIVIFMTSISLSIVSLMA